MAYAKTTWNTGDVVTAYKLNNIETGIENAHTNAESAYNLAQEAYDAATQGGGGAEPFYVDLSRINANYWIFFDNTNPGSDMTYQRLLTAFGEGRPVILRWYHGSDGSYSYFPITGCGKYGDMDYRVYVSALFTNCEAQCFQCTSTVDIPHITLSEGDLEQMPSDW